MDYIILFHDGSNITIPKDAVEAINKSKATELKIGGSIYKKASISKILTVADYFEQYPEKRIEEKKEFKIEDDRYKGLTVEQITELDKYRFQGVLKGLKKFIDEEMAKGITPKNAIEIYHEKLDRYKKKFASTQ